MSLKIPVLLILARFALAAQISGYNAQQNSIQCSGTTAYLDIASLQCQACPNGQVPFNSGAPLALADVNELFERSFMPLQCTVLSNIDCICDRSHIYMHSMCSWRNRFARSFILSFMCKRILHLSLRDDFRQAFEYTERSNQI